MVVINQKIHVQPRKLWPQLEPQLITDEAIVITGPRQVGKTTTLHWLLEQVSSSNKLYLDLENLVDRELFERKDYDSIINEFSSRGLDTKQQMYVALDEIHLVDNLPSVVKYLYDHYHIKFFLTGSSAYYIKNKFTESMAGRKRLYQLLPLSFQEFLQFKGVDYQLPTKLPINQSFPVTTFQKLHSLYQEFIDFGGLPQVVLTSDRESKTQLLEEIYSSYINFDVQALADFSSTKLLRETIKLLAARIGSTLNISELASILGVSRTTVNSYLDFLEQTYLIRTIEVYSDSVDVKARLQKKPYFIDTGIASVNAQLSAESMFENAVCHQLAFYGSLTYYKTTAGEVDFILDDGKDKIAFEVKLTPTKRDEQTLAKRSKDFPVTKVRVIGKEQSASYDSYLWGGLIS